MTTSPSTPTAATNYHLSISVDGALRRSDRELDGWMEHNGRTLSGAEARLRLKAARNEGKRLLPDSRCDNFDAARGCLGHPAGKDQP